MNRYIATRSLWLPSPCRHLRYYRRKPSENWSGFATVQGRRVPVHLRLSTSTHDGPVTGGFVNERQFSPASRVTLAGGHLTLNFDYFAHLLDGNLQQGTFTGTYGGGRGQPAPVERHEDAPQKKALPTGVYTQTNSIRGDWEIAVKSPKGEDAWTLRISPLSHGEIKAVILRIDARHQRSLRRLRPSCRVPGQPLQRRGACPLYAEAAA